MADRRFPDLDRPFSVVTLSPEINSVAAQKGQRIRVKATSDSGAAASVLPADLLKEQVGTRESSSQGMLYSAAGPTSRPIRNVGQRVLRGVTESGSKLQLPFEAVENITKPLASVSKMVDAGQAVLYHPAGSAIFDLKSGNNKELNNIFGRVLSNDKYSKVPLTRENDVYNFELHANVPASQAANKPGGEEFQQGFPRQR